MDEFGQKLRYFDKMRNLPFEEKLSYSKRLVKSAVDRFKGRLCVACSFGKDSTVALHLALQFYPNVKVLFNNTGVELPETIRFKDKLVKEWNLNYHETKPRKSFWRCVKEYGYPKIRGNWDGRKDRGIPACCYWLKDEPAHRWYKVHGIRAIILGITACESYSRRFTIIKYGDDYQTEKYLPWPCQKVLPLAYWTDHEVWKYIEDNNLPYNEAYDKGYERVGCMPCSGYKGWREHLAKHNPKLLMHILKDMAEKGDERGFQPTLEMYS